MRLADLREQVEAVTSALARTEAAALSGLAPNLDLGPAFRSAPEAVSWEGYALAKEEAAKSEGKRAARLKVLTAHLYTLLEKRQEASALQRAHEALNV